MSYILCRLSLLDQCTILRWPGEEEISNVPASNSPGLNAKATMDFLSSLKPRFIFQFFDFSDRGMGFPDFYLLERSQGLPFFEFYS